MKKGKDNGSKESQEEEKFHYRYFDNYKYGGLTASDTFTEIHIMSLK
jgi:hypothetical protein